LRPGFTFNGERIPLINQQRGIFKPHHMQFLLSIRTVFPRPGRQGLVRRSTPSAPPDI
jgi:putative restriction endonuclease